MSTAAAVDAGELAARAAELETATPEEILRFAFARFPRIAISTAFGPEGCALVAMAVAIQPDVPVFTVDTDFLFPESIALRQRFVDKYGVRLTVLTGEVTLAEQERRHGADLWQRDTDLCCALRKVEPTGRALVGLDAWIAGLRRDQGQSRAGISVLELYDRPDESSRPSTSPSAQGRLERPLVKVNPLARWTRKDTWTYLLAHDVPYNPLLDQGYKSIGCWPCTRPVAADADERAGRWNGAKAECGIHTFLPRAGDTVPASSLKKS